MPSNFASSEFQLVLHNVAFLAGGVINIGVAFFVIYASRKHLNALATTFALMSFSVATFQISHVLGVMAPDANTSRLIFMFNISNFPIGMFMTHWFLEMAGRAKKRRNILIAIYASGIIMMIVYIIFPKTFLLESVPKLYFPFYYEPGSLHTVMRMWFNLVAIYYFYELVSAYRETKDPVQKNRYKYVFFSIIYGVILGSTAILLVYDVPFNPMLSSFFGLYTLPLAYAIVIYELLDFKVLAKKAMLYALAIVGAGVLIIVVNFTDDYLLKNGQYFPKWVIYMPIAIIIGASSVFVWRKARESDILKYEFINIITHKFRTPLTRIKWSLETAEEENNSRNKEVLSTIKTSALQLVELTNALITLNDTDNSRHIYKTTPVYLTEMIDNILETYKSDFERKPITILKKYNVPPGQDVFYADTRKIEFALQIIIENALFYTPAKGSITLSTEKKGRLLVLRVKDTGIGLSKTDMQYIFSKFYRSDNARRYHTEGTGIGLYMAKKIAHRNGGSLTIKSEGLNKGSTVEMVFPETR